MKSMNVRNDVDGLNSLLGVQSQSVAATSATRAGKGASGGASLTTDQATVSSAGSSVAQAASASDVRSERVAAVQAALASGTYNVPASAVAGKIIDSMLSSSAN
jgi:negative regulator of flagellin synthesis FlgM